MIYEEAIQSAKYLSQVEDDSDILELSHAQFPGTHCPLFGALMTASYLKDLAVLNIGTSECTFYGKDFARLRQKGEDQVFSLVIHQTHVTFGMAEAIESAVHQIIDTCSPSGVLLVSTCVVELIGEDVAAIASDLNNRLNLPILYVKTEHFKCNSHMPGIEDTLYSLRQVMVPMTKLPRTVNVIGHRFDGFESSELYRILNQAGVRIHLSIPSACDIKALATAGQASLNLVTDFTAEPLAIWMEKHLEVPYVHFGQTLCPDKLLKQYLAIGDLLKVDLTQYVKPLYTSTKDLISDMKKSLQGKTFIHGNAPIPALACVSFMVGLGMVPLWIQLRALYDQELPDKKAILEAGYDPKISRIANITPMRTVYDQLKPNIYIGHEYPMELMKRNITQVTFDQEASGLGFELPLGMMRQLKGGRNR